MEILIGFAVRSDMGAEGGREKLDELNSACLTIATSAEFQALLTVATSLLARVALERGRTAGGLAGLNLGNMGEFVGDQLKLVRATMAQRNAA